MKHYMLATAIAMTLVAPTTSFAFSSVINMPTLDIDTSADAKVGKLNIQLEEPTDTKNTKSSHKED